MKTPPDKFTATLTEKDRQAAGPFGSCTTCLVATVLRRRGYSNVREAVNSCTINGARFSHEVMSPRVVDRLNPPPPAPPFYGPAVVGMKITFTRQY